LNFGGLKQTQPPGGRSQIVLNWTTNNKLS
jgi:hypothetical protein